MPDGPEPPPPPTNVPGSAHESYLIAIMISFLICINTHFHHEKDRIQTFHTVAILFEFSFKIFEPMKNAYIIKYIYIFKEIMLTIYLLTS